MNDDFIGRTFGENNQVEVVGWFGERRGNGKLYTVKCSECTKDPELFGDGYFKSTKSHLLAGSIPCGCSKKVAWSEAQQLIRVQRVCVKKNIRFISAIDGFKGNKSVLRLECLQDGHVWETSFDSLINSSSGCPVCGHERISKCNLKPDHIMVESFMASCSFADGTVFWRSDRLDSLGYRGFWKYSCPHCSSDEYVSEGLCSGVFEGRSNNLQLGKLTCRCSKTYRWTREQREYQVQQIIDDEGLEYDFIGIVGEYKGANTQLRLWCREHSEEFNPSIVNFIIAGTRCPSCAQHGFDPNKPSHLYVLEVKGSYNSFTGYGISNDITTRFRAHRKTLSDGSYDVIKCMLFEGSGREILDMENKIKQTFKNLPQELKGFKREATYAHYYSDVVALALTTLKECTNDLPI